MTPNPIELAHIGPFDSRMVLEFRTLVGDVQADSDSPESNKRDWLLRHIALQLEREAPEMRVLFDRFVSAEVEGGPAPDHVTAPIEERYRYRADRHASWLESGASSSGSLVFDEGGGPSGSRGALLRIEPGWTGDLADAMVDIDARERERSLAASRQGVDLDSRANISARLRCLGVQSVRLDRLRLDFFRHGVGVFSLRASIPTRVARSQLAELMEMIGALVPLHPGLVAAIDRADEKVGVASERALAALERTLDAHSDFESMKTLERVLFQGDGRGARPATARLPGTPRWTNTILLDVDPALWKSKAKAPLGRATWSILRATPAGGAIPAELHCRGYVIVGWGRSIALDASPTTLSSTLDGIRRLQAEWRTLQVLGAELRQRIGRFAKLQHRTSTGVGEQIRDIVRLKLECELLQANEDRYLAAAEPLEYAVYVQGRRTWRMDRMVEGVRRSVDTLELLQDAWARRREASEAKRLNVVVLLVGLVAMAGVYTDVMDYTGGEAVRGWGEPLRHLGYALLAGGLAVVAYRLGLFARLARQWRLMHYRRHVRSSQRHGGVYRDR